MLLPGEVGFTSTILNPDAIGKRITEADEAARAKAHTQIWLTGIETLDAELITTAPTAVTRNRYDQRQLSTVLQNAFKVAVQKLVTDGTYKAIVAYHMDMSHNMHGSMGPLGLLRFLPWHRRYLVELENRLQEADQALRPAATELVTIPYWSWNDPFPDWLKGFLPATNPSNGKPVPARTLSPPPEKPSTADIELILTGFKHQMPNSSVNDYTRFTFGLEGWGKRPDESRLPAHNQVHDWVGGIMGNTSTSPADPVFWLHHAEVDRLWSQWQAKNPGAHPVLTGKDRIMDPWHESYDEVVAISALGYSYSDVASP